MHRFRVSRPLNYTSSFCSVLTSSSFSSSLRFQSNSTTTTPAASQQQEDKSQWLTFPQAYQDLLADSEDEENKKDFVKQSINVVGSVVPHAARPPIINSGAVPVRAWLKNVPVDREAVAQLEQLSSLKDIIKHYVVAMPDLHGGVASLVGSVIPTYHAIIPGAVGVDIGCGMNAVKTSLKEEDLPADREVLRLAIELAIPHGRTNNGQPGNDAGGWRGNVPRHVASVWNEQLEKDFKIICQKRPILEKTNHVNHLGSLGTGNHFVSVCIDEDHYVWLMLHSGSRGVGNKIGSVFIEEAKKDMGKLISNLPNENLAYLKEGTTNFDDYCFALEWSQKYARLNRELMMQQAIQALRDCKKLPAFTVDKDKEAVNCHHNYVEKMIMPSDGKEVFLTRKGATSAKLGELGVIPSSMGQTSYIVRGKGNNNSYCSCSHGAGRRFSRGETMRRFTLEDHLAAMEGVACRRDKDVIDETPAAYKPIADVMDAQSDLVEIVHSLKEIVSVKG